MYGQPGGYPYGQPDGSGMPPYPYQQHMAPHHPYAPPYHHHHHHMYAGRGLPCRRGLPTPQVGGGGWGVP